MSYRKVSGVVAAAATALALVGSAYGDPGKSPNAAPGPAGRAAKTHGKSATAHAKQHATQANLNASRPRKGGRTDRRAGKITICHRTESAKNPYVEITIPRNRLHGHNHHHAGDAWDDIIPAPAGGCPPTGQQSSEQKPGGTTQQPTSTVARLLAATPEVAATAPAEQAVLGTQSRGTSAPARASVLAPTSAPASALAARRMGAESLPFTGFQVVLVVIAAVVVLIAGFALRRAITGR